MNKLEKCAAAVMRARLPELHGGIQLGCEVKDWKRETIDNPHVDQAMQQARAVLEELLEVTTEMVDAAFSGTVRGHPSGHIKSAITHILNGGD